MQPANPLNCPSAAIAVELESAPSPWITRPELAERLRVQVSTLASWAKNGIGPRYARFGKYARYRLSDVIAWEEAQLTGGEG